VKLWLKWFLAQCLMFIAAVLGVFVLPIPCLRQAWNVNAKSIKDGRPIDTWNSSWLNSVYGNPEDGVSGNKALVWENGILVPYRQKSRPWVRAYLWSGFRNTADNLKYKFAIQQTMWLESNPPQPTGGPIKYWWKFKFGYQIENGYNVPVVGLK